jgi:protein-S-isoprenylcysteine O-methyltransferase Ste14
MAAGFAVIAIFYRHILPAHGQGLAWEILGLGMVLLGYLLRISARGVKAELNPDGKTLVVKGPYALTRNPMYLGTLLIGIGFIMALLRWWVSAIFLIIYLVIYIPQIRKEEVKLMIFFKGVFIDYCNQTPRFFPKIKKLLATNPGDYLAFKLSWLKKELPSLAMTLVLIIGIKILIHLYL